MISSNLIKTLSINAFALLFLLFSTNCSDSPVQSIEQESAALQQEGLELQESRNHRGTQPAVSINHGNSAHARATESIVDIAAGNPDFSILVQAVVFAGLDGVLDGRRQLTVFAPTNAAFQALLSNLNLTAGELLSPGNEDLVRSILLYHVAPGKRFAKTIAKPNTRVNTLQNEFLFVYFDNSDVMIGNDTNGYATIVATDIFASNGIIHVVDKVLLQPSFGN